MVSAAGAEFAPTAATAATPVRAPSHHHMDDPHRRAGEFLVRVGAQSRTLRRYGLWNRSVYSLLRDRALLNDYRALHVWMDVARVRESAGGAECSCDRRVRVDTWDIRGHAGRGVEEDVVADRRERERDGMTELGGKHRRSNERRRRVDDQARPRRWARSK